MKLSKKLKEVTKEHHILAERMNPAMGIMSHDITMDKFTAFLTANFYAYTIGINTISYSASELPDQFKKMTVFKMKDFLKNDLDYLKVATAEHIAQELKIDDKLPSTIGVLYVLQGSMLGTMILKKNYGQCDLSIIIEKPDCFYGIDASSVGKEWRGFIRFMDDLPLSETDIVKACAAAKATFGLFISLYEQIV